MMVMVSWLACPKTTDKKAQTAFSQEFTRNAVAAGKKQKILFIGLDICVENRKNALCC